MEQPWILKVKGCRAKGNFVESNRARKYLRTGKSSFITMKKIRILTRCFIGAVALMSFFACHSNEDELVVFAAASLTDVLTEVKEEFEFINKTRVQYNFGGSQSLAVELSKGSPGHIFISAGEPPMEFLYNEMGSKISGVTSIATNSLVIVTKPQTADLQDYSSLADLDLISLADPNLAPAGVYSREFLVNTGLWSFMEDRLIFAADVRAALNYVKSGNVDAAIVYMTDGLTEPSLLIWDIVPPDSYAPISYPVAVIEAENRNQSGRLFVEFLVSPEVGDIFHSYGFR